MSATPEESREYLRWRINDAPSADDLTVVNTCSCPWNGCLARRGQACFRSKRPHRIRIEAYYGTLYSAQKSTQALSDDTLKERLQWYPDNPQLRAEAELRGIQ